MEEIINIKINEEGKEKQIIISIDEKIVKRGGIQMIDTLIDLISMITKKE